MPCNACRVFRGNRCRYDSRCFQFWNEAEGAWVAEAVREKHAIKVVAFVLHNPGMEAFNAFIHRLPVPIESLHAQSQPTGHLPPQPRHTQAAFPAVVALRAPAG